MVSSQINGLGFTAAVNAETAYVPIESENAFLQALQGQMPKAQSPAAGNVQLSPEALERIAAFVQNLADKEGNGTQAIVKRIMELLIARITGGDTGKKAQDKEQIGELSEENVGFDEIPQDVFELIAQELQQIVNEQAQAHEAVSAQLSVRTVTLSLTPEQAVKAMPSQTTLQPDAFLENESAIQQTQNLEQILQDVKSQTPSSLEAVHTEATLALNRFGLSGQEAVAQQPQQTEQPVFATQEIEAKAEKILNELISFAKKELGLTKAEIAHAETAQSTEHTIGTARQFFSVQSMVKQQDETELARLLGAVRETADEAESGFAVSSVDETELLANTDEVAEEIVSDVAQTSAFSQTSTTQSAQIRPVEVQVAQRVYEALSSMQTGKDGEVTFRMTLNPETLGEIEVKIVASEGKATVEIITQSKQTQSILAERLEGLQTALRQEGVELEKYQVIYAPDQAQTDSRSYDGSSKNPYSRRRSEGNDETDESIEFSEILKAL